MAAPCHPLTLNLITPSSSSSQGVQTSCFLPLSPRSRSRSRSRSPRRSRYQCQLYLYFSLPRLCSLLKSSFELLKIYIYRCPIRQLLRLMQRVQAWVDFSLTMACPINLPRSSSMLTSSQVTFSLRNSMTSSSLDQQGIPLSRINIYFLVDSSGRFSIWFKVRIILEASQIQLFLLRVIQLRQSGSIAFDYSRRSLKQLKIGGNEIPILRAISGKNFVSSQGCVVATMIDFISMMTVAAFWKIYLSILMKSQLVLTSQA